MQWISGYCWTFKPIGNRRCLKDEWPNNSGREIARVLRRDGSRTSHERGKSNRKKCPSNRKSNSFSLDGVIPFPLLLMWSPVTLIKIEFVGGGRGRRGLGTPPVKIEGEDKQNYATVCDDWWKIGQTKYGNDTRGFPKQRRKHETETLN